jgi:hypothetical protein
MEGVIYWRGIIFKTDREYQLARVLAHIAPMVCFRVVTGEVPEGERAGDCVCFSCSAMNVLVQQFGEAKAARLIDAAQEEKQLAKGEQVDG